MAIFRRGNVWWYSFGVKGRFYRGSCRTEDEKLAQEYHDRLKADLWRGKYLQEKKRRTIAESIDRFLREHERKRSYSDDLRYANWWKGEFKSAQVEWLDELTFDMVADIRDDELGRVTRRGGTVSNATMNRKLAFLRSVLKCAELEWEWIDKAPKIKLLKGEMQRKRFLEPDEVIRLVTALPKPYSDMALFAVSTGLRQSNVMNLRWDQVSLQRRTATFPEQLMKNGQPFSCALNDTAMSVIRKWQGQHDEYVFHKDGGRVKELPSRLWSKAVTDAGLVDVRWHDLRHTWASLLRQSGVELADLQEMGGWESPLMVQRYAHLNVEHLQSKAAKMDGLLTNKSPTVHLVHSRA